MENGSTPTPRRDAQTVDDDARWAKIQTLAWNIGKRPIESLSETEAALCGAFWRAKAAITRNVELERELSAALSRVAELERAGAQPVASEFVGALKQAVERAIRRPNDQFAYSRCNLCDASWWEREEHRHDCDVLKWQRLLASPPAPPQAEALKDAGRIDFLQANPRSVSFAEGYGSPGTWAWRDSGLVIHTAASLRAAIDAALQAGGKHG